MGRTEKSKKRTKFLFVLIILTAILSITATYAWFSVQRDVEISGLEVNVEVAENMQISLDGETWSQTIAITDMNQLLGTVKDANNNVDTSIPQAKAGAHNNYIPSELLPVSSIGTISSGKMTFVKGVIDGKKLTNIAKCDESKIGQADDDNATHPYLSFDIYLRNLSRLTEGNLDPLQLNVGSSVTASTADTGLENAVRIGLVAYNTNTANLTDDGNTVRTTTASGGSSDIACIWEPNYKRHTNYVVVNDSRIATNNEDFETYAIKDNVTADIEDTTTYSSDTMDKVKTNKVTQADVAGVQGTATTGTEPTTLKQINGTADMGLKPNTITRVRVYLWLEGQDPDCIDLASIGDEVQATIKLTKPKNTPAGS